MNQRYVVTTILISVATSVMVFIMLFGFSPMSRSQAPVAATAIEDISVVQAVQKANPAVVSIVITKDVPVIERYYERVPNPYDFFGDFFSIPRYRENGTEEREIGGGSGFFVSADGLIVTNQHVVSDKEAEYTVYTNDGKKHPARVAAQDERQDIALIKIDQELGSDYPYLTFGESKNLDLGQTVIAIGNALGEFRNTVSVGVVSGLSRSIIAGSSVGTIEELNEVIQTDAAINPGNSGGPLLDLQGNVIGVNVAVAVGSQNIGFALPSDVVKGAVESALKR